MSKKLYKSRDDQKLCGVCAGLGKFFDIDPTIIRLLWVVITLAGGAGIVAYIVCALVIPDEPTYGGYDNGYVEYTDVNDRRD